jgi:hypothetical protein
MATTDRDDSFWEIVEGLKKMTLSELTAYAKRAGIRTETDDDPPIQADKEDLAIALAKSFDAVAVSGEYEISATTSYTVCPDVRLEEVRWRVDSNPSNGRARYISYIDARAAAATLDEWLGPDSWEPTYTESTLHGEMVLWCHLALHFADRTVVRSDVTTFKEGRGKGNEKIAQGIKGYVSDAFKRAAATAGVGRNVYRLPELWLPVNDRGYPPPNIAELIAAELKKRGYDTDAPTAVDEEISTVEATEPAATDWTRWAKNSIWHNLNEDGPAAERFYKLALERTGIPEPFKHEEDAARVVAAATTLAVAQTVEVPTDEAGTAALKDALADRDVQSPAAVADAIEDTPRATEETAAAEPRDYGPGESPFDGEIDTPETREAWTTDGHKPDDPEWAFEVAAKRSVLRSVDGNVAEAAKVFETMTADLSHPLSRDDYHVVKAGLAAPAQ